MTAASRSAINLFHPSASSAAAHFDSGPTMPNDNIGLSLCAHRCRHGYVPGCDMQHRGRITLGSTTGKPIHPALPSSEHRYPMLYRCIGHWLGAPPLDWTDLTVHSDRTIQTDVQGGTRDVISNSEITGVVTSELPCTPTLVGDVISIQTGEGGSAL